MALARAEYDIHGLWLAVEGGGRALLGPFETAVGAYASPGGGEGAIRISIDYGRPDPPADEGLTEFWRGSLADGSPAAFHCGPGRRRIEMPQRVCTDIDLPARAVRCVVAHGAEDCLLDACVLPVLCELLAQAGHYVLHAASVVAEVAARRRAVIVSGVSGAGKTSAALALAAAGMGVLADDVTFYHPGGGEDGGTVWGLRIRCKAHPRTLELLPHLREFSSRPGGRDGELLLDVGSFGRPTTGQTASPGAILFLDPRNGQAHRAEPMDRVEAIARLTRENVRAVETSRHAPAAKAFQALAELVRLSRTFRVSLSPRLDRLGELVASLLE